MYRAVFLDRDGVITEDPPHYAHLPEQMNLIPGAVEGIRLLNRAQFKVIVVSNQSGVGRGYYTERDVAIFHDLMVKRLGDAGACIDAMYYCPHHPDSQIEIYRKNCNCRKPGNGMLQRAEIERGINLSQSFLIGDKISDIEAGQRSGCVSMLVLTGHGKSESMKRSRIKPDLVVQDLLEGARYIVRNDRTG